MAVILAIQPNLSHTGALKQALCGSIDTNLVVADSIEEALTAIDSHVPDLVIVDALTPPTLVTDLMAYLRLLPRTEHVQAISVPLIQLPSDFDPPSLSRPRARLRDQILRRVPSRPSVPVGWNPDAFAEDVGEYLAWMHVVKSEAELKRAAAERRSRERRRTPRWRGVEVAITAARLVNAPVDLINISAGGALLRTEVRPRTRGQVQYAWPTLTLYQASGEEISRAGQPIRCHVRTIDDGRVTYEVAFQFTDALELEPVAGAHENDSV